jgi:DNA polymerase-1
MCSLAVQYRMGEESLASRIGQSVARAGELLHLHHDSYPDYWLWSEQVMSHARLRLELPTVFGWTLYLGDSVKSRTIYNYPMQGNGSEMLRLACWLATERGIKVCAPIHDALLVEAPLNSLDETVAMTQGAMVEASRIILNGFSLRSEAKLVVHPHRYEDEKGAAMWNLVWEEAGSLKK